MNTHHEKLGSLDQLKGNVPQRPLPFTYHPVHYHIHSNNTSVPYVKGLYKRRLQNSDCSSTENTMRKVIYILFLLTIRLSYKARHNCLV